MEASSLNNAFPNSVGNAKCPVCVRIRRCQAVNLDVEGKSIAVGCPKHQAASRELHILAIPRGKEGKATHLLVFHLLCRGKQIVHRL
jgi:hypothetical protein